MHISYITKNPGKLFRFKEEIQGRIYFLNCINDVRPYGPNQTVGWGSFSADAPCVLTKKDIFMFLDFNKKRFSIYSYNFLLITSSACKTIGCFEQQFLLDLEEVK